MDIQEKVRNEYTITQDYTHGNPYENAPLIPENTIQYPGQLEKPDTPAVPVTA
jgi:NADH-quinone oxidoreductase subunit B